MFTEPIDLDEPNKNLTYRYLLEACGEVVRNQYLNAAWQTTASREKGSSNSNLSVQVRLKHPSDAAKSVSFHPKFTYPIFGDEETIFGYKDLKIDIQFKADTLKPNLDVSWGAQFEPVGDTKADAVKEKLEPFLPTFFHPEQDATPASTSFEPPGECQHRYTANGREFGIWSTKLTDPAAKGILNNMQIFVPFLIEGGSLIELDDPEWTIDRWRIFFLYEQQPYAIDQDTSLPDKQVYSLAGYSTAYRVFFLDTEKLQSYGFHPTNGAATTISTTDSDSTWPSFDPTLPSNQPSRQRISQFLILPPYQSHGHGSHLYNTMFRHFLTHPSIREITVEDPNESFDDLRDINDLLRLRHTHPTFSRLTINDAVKLSATSDVDHENRKTVPKSSLLDLNALASLRSEAKLAPRQFDRLVDMQLLAAVPPYHRKVARTTKRDRATDANDRRYYFWRLIVKQRLYRHNLDALNTMEDEEKAEKLDETLRGVEEDYERLIKVVEGREERGGVMGMLEPAAGGEKMNGVSTTAGATLAAEGGTPKRGFKRKIIEDDEEDDDDDEDTQKNDADCDARMSHKDAETEAGLPERGSKRPRFVDVED
ncbi:MAG: histone acetyltransferase 1 [Alyxoria varia]|nr:MAG: histone acetyltransferase 1 [Alyxoria varia]